MVPVEAGADAGRQVAQLREALRLVAQLAGAKRPTGHGDWFDEAARVSAGYAVATPVVQRRFDATAAETASWAAAGIEALLAAAEAGAPLDAPAARLAERLERAISQLAAMILAQAA